MSTPLLTRSQLVSDLRKLGVNRGGAVMVHTRMSAIGWVVGGAPTVVDALLGVLGRMGTLLVLTGWEDRPPYHQDQWDDATRKAYREECPVFDPLVARAERDHGRVPEAVRTWPGAVHSRHPVAAFAAVGARADWIVSGQSLDEGYGSGSPLERLVNIDGEVLLLGAPLDSVTLLHHAEYIAEVETKRWVEYEMPVLVEGKRTWRRIRELDSSLGAFASEDMGEDAFGRITRDAIAAGIGRSGRVGNAESHLLPARGLVEYAATWMERQFA